MKAVAGRTPIGVRTTARHTSRSLYVGEPEHRVRATHAVARRLRCRGYDALVLRAGGAARTVVYVVDGIVWGFGLTLAGEHVCR